MRADIHDGPEQMLQSEAGYIDARPLTASSAKPLATHGRTIHPGQIRKSGRATGQSALPSRTDVASRACQVREWDGPAVLPPRTAQRMSWGFEARGAHRHVP